MTIVPQKAPKTTPTPRTADLYRRVPVAEIAQVVRVWDRLVAATTKAGKPLSRRVIESCDRCGFGVEWADGGETVFGAYGMGAVRALPAGAPLPPPDHLLTARLTATGLEVRDCTCEDAQCRKRLCIHQVWLAIEGGFALRLPSAPQATVVPAPQALAVTRGAGTGAALGVLEGWK